MRWRLNRKVDFSIAAGPGKINPCVQMWLGVMQLEKQLWTGSQGRLFGWVCMATRHQSHLTNMFFSLQRNRLLQCQINNTLPHLAQQEKYWVSISKCKTTWKHDCVWGKQGVNTQVAWNAVLFLVKMFSEPSLWGPWCCDNILVSEAHPTQPQSQIKP